MNRFIVEVVNPKKQTIAMLMVKQFEEVYKEISMDIHEYEVQVSDYVVKTKVFQGKYTVYDIDGKKYIFENLNDALRVHLNNRFKGTDKLRGCTVRVIDEFVQL